MAALGSFLWELYTAITRARRAAAAWMGSGFDAIEGDRVPEKLMRDAEVTWMPSSFDKRIDHMDRLADMAHFPAVVHAGATVNVLATITVTWFVQPHFSQPFAPLLWTIAVLALNLLPVAVLRLAHWDPGPVPTLRAMDFFRDQHRFSDWVYLAASANMAFWILAAWSVFAACHTTGWLALMMAAGFLATFAPVLLRGQSIAQG